VFVSSPKEIHFFDNDANFNRGVEWYLKHFRRGACSKAIGEITAGYLTGARSVSEIRDVLGEMQIIVSLRNPVDRFISHYKHCIRDEKLPKREFRTLRVDTLHAAVQRVPQLHANGVYHARLKEFVRVFGRGQVHVIIKDDIDGDPAGVVSKLYAFVGVDAGYTPPVLFQRVSPGIVPKYAFLERLRRRLSGYARRYAPWVINEVKRLGFAELYRKVNAENGTSGLVIDDLAREELRQSYAEDVARTEELLGRSLPSWR